MHDLSKKQEESSVTFEEALEAAGNGKFQYIVVIIGGLIILCSYVSVGAVAFVLPAAQCDLDMDSEAKGRLASVGYVGLILSCHFWGFLSDTLGRRYILIRCLLIDGLLYFVTSVTPYFPVILVLRLFNGFVSSGGVASIYAYMGEFHSDKNRTKALMTASMVASFAYFLMPLYAWLTIPGEWALDLFPSLTYKPWRLFYAGCGVPSIICAFLIYFLPESPKFLLAKGKVNEAVGILKHINDVNKGNTKVEYSVTNIKINETEKVSKLGSDRNKAVAFLQLMWNQTVPLFKVPHRINIALVCLSQYLIYFSNGGMYLWLPETMNRLATFRKETNDNSATFCDVVEYKRNFSLILTNTTETKGVPTILKYNDVSYNRQAINSNSDNTSEIKCSEHVDFTVYYYLAILGVIQSINLGVIATLSRLVNKKYLLTGFTFGALVSSIAIQEIRVTEYAAYDACLLIIFTGAVIPIINSVVVELFPTNLRGMAGCLTLMSCRLGTVTTNIIAGMLIDENCTNFIWCFVAAMIVCLITVLLLPTKASKVLPEDKTNTTRV